MKNIFLLFYFLSYVLTIGAQTIEPSLISTTAYYNLSGDIKLHYAIGEPAISTYHNGIVLSEGFYQNSIGLISSEESIQLDIATKIYPNPCVEQLHVEFDSKEKIALNIYDLNGRKVLPQLYSLDGQVINVKSLTAGIYFLQLSNLKNQHNIIKFIKS